MIPGINWFRLRLERFMLRGTPHRLLIIGGLLGLISLAGGGLVLRLGVGFEGLGDATWWAFLRLTDPGYLGDDVGTSKRIVSTLLTILGYVLFMGCLVAILTQGLNESIRRLESGLTPLAGRHHIAILGWTNRTPEIMRDLLSSQGRVRRFLRVFGTRRLKVAVLANEVNAHVVEDLKDRLGPLWDGDNITFRSGDALVNEHLPRINPHQASAILLPGADYRLGGGEASDDRIIKILVALHHTCDVRGTSLPLVVTEIFDPRKLPVARHAYRGPLEIVASDQFLARAMVQSLRHPGVLNVYAELLSFSSGSTLFTLEIPPSLSGNTFGDMRHFYDRVLPLGMVRQEGDSLRHQLFPEASATLRADDQMILMARSIDDCKAKAAPAAPALDIPLPETATVNSTQRILILGWNRKISLLLQELNRHQDRAYEVDIFTRLPEADRRQFFDDRDAPGPNVILRHLTGNRALPTHLDRVPLTSYDSIIVLASDDYETGSEADTRVLVCALLLQDLLPPDKEGPHVLIELMDPSNEPLLRDTCFETLVTPTLLSSMLTQVTLQRPLAAVYDELFGPTGPEIGMHPLSTFDLGTSETTFRQLRDGLLSQGALLIGLRHSDQRIRLIPDPDEAPALQAGDELILIR